MAIDAFSQALGRLFRDRPAEPPEKAQTHKTQTGNAAGESGSNAGPDEGPTVEADFTFDDVLDIVNPLQHLPLVNMAYRTITGDTLSPHAQVIGGILFGGPIGGAAAVLNAIIEQDTGRDIGDNMIALLTGDERSAGATATPPSPPQAATGSTPPAPNTPAAATVVAASGAAPASAPHPAVPPQAHHRPGRPVALHPTAPAPAAHVAGPPGRIARPAPAAAQVRTESAAPAPAAAAAAAALPRPDAAAGAVPAASSALPRGHEPGLRTATNLSTLRQGNWMSLEQARQPRFRPVAPATGPARNRPSPAADPSGPAAQDQMAQVMIRNLLASSGTAEATDAGLPGVIPGPALVPAGGDQIAESMMRNLKKYQEMQRSRLTTSGAVADESL